ncbi:MAG: hypothetical protein LC721_10495, partial [Actinobacteria bacterium]|nr:hypothetical protein [Actinomycetota bacterium]
DPTFVASVLAPVACDANRLRGAHQRRTTGVEMSAGRDERRRGARLYPFPGGVFERWDDTDDDTAPGVYVEFYQSCNDARAFGPGESVPADDETEPA